MVKKQYLKSTGRLFLKHIIRLLSISAIFVVSIGLMSGLGVVKYNVKDFVNDVYHTCNVHDLEIRDVADNKIALLYDNLNNNKDKFNIDQIALSYSYDILDLSSNEKFAKRIILSNYNKINNTIDKLLLTSGEYPKSGEVLVNEPSNDINAHKVGDYISFYNPLLDKTISARVSGIVKNPTLLAKAREPSNYFLLDKYKYLNDVFYYNMSDQLSKDKATNISITFKNEIRQKFNCMSNKYLNDVEITRKYIENFLEPSSIGKSILTLEANFSFTSLVKYADKVGVISIIFISFFSLITLLVVFSTMSRLLDEDRSSMAVLKTLGYSNFAIAMRYIIFVFIAGIIGCFLSIFPSVLVNNMIINGFMMQYKLFNIAVPIFTPLFFIVSSITLLLSIILTLISSLKAASHKPVELLTPKTPKIGKTILLERIKVIWMKLSFKYKSTCRNVFLFKGRFFMTFFSLIASTTIVFASLALFDNSFKLEMAGLSAIRIISIVLLIFSAILCALVVYNITNINISERKREIATLMVLGYRNNEVKGYIYREIYIMAIISSIVGLPTGVGFTAFVFKYMNFGLIKNINWWTYIITPILVCLFAFIATLLLHNKIIKTDMNESLKVLE